MITSFLHWSDDISEAPRGEMVTTKFHQMVKGEPVERSRTEHVPTKILSVSACGKVCVTYWVPEKLTQSGSILSHGHWSGFAERPEYGSGPVLWAAMPDAAELLASHSAISCAISITEEEDA
jgi:hypothetical protein